MCIEWSHKEIEFLINNITVMTHKEIAIHLNRSTQSVLHKASRLNIRRHQCIIIDKEDDTSLVAVYKNGRANVFAKIDTADKHLIADKIWSYAKGYAITIISPKKTIKMHNLITGIVGIDHKDHNGLNNTRNNLRPCNQSQNGANSRKLCVATSKFKGVQLDPKRNKWIVHIVVNKRSYFLGRYELEIEAAKIYDAAARFYFKEFACTNFEGSDKLERKSIRQLNKSSGRKATSKYKGVHWLKRDKKWQASITINYKTIKIGRFETEVDAATAYDIFVKTNNLDRDLNF